MRDMRATWKALNDAAVGTPAYSDLTPSHLCIARGVRPFIERYIRGCVLDAGAGSLGCKRLLASHARRYVSVDVVRESSALDVQGDLNRLPFPSAAFDSVFCSQVLEHVPEPLAVLHELRRVLKTGGHLVVTVPHLSYLHGEPHDYYRFTHHGLRALLDRAGLACVETAPVGGIVSFVLTLPAILSHCLFAGFRGLYPLVRAMNRWLSRAAVALDARVDRRKLYALNFVAVGRKEEA